MFGDREGPVWIEENLKEFEIGLDPFEILFGSNRVCNHAVDTVLHGPTCQRPTATLPCSPLSLPHPAADTRAPTHPAQLVSCVAPHRLHPLARGRSGRVSSPRAAYRCAWAPSLPFPSFHVEPAPDPPFSLPPPSRFRSRSL
jgi:hypothetical protein